MQRILFLTLFLVPIQFIFGQSGEDLTIQPIYQNAVNQILEKTIVKDAFDLIKKEDDLTLKEHILLTEIPAPPFKEEARAKKFKEMLIETGIDSVWIDSIGNVIGLRKGSIGKKKVVLNAHLDTVFPEGTDTKVEIVEDTLFAPGVGDDTRGLAMVLAVLRTMNKLNIKTEADILFIGTVGEEGLGDLRGVKHLFSPSGPKIDSWIAIDGGDLGRVNFKALGSYRYRVTFRGPGGHSWGAFGLGNPHHALGAAIKHFVKKADQFTSYGPKTSYNVGRIGGGTSVNSIPFSSWMEIDMRSFRPERLDSMAIILKEAVQKGLDEQNEIRRDGRPLTVEIDFIGNRPSGELSPQLPLIQRAMASLKYFGVKPHITRGSTDSNIPISMGIPAVTIGRGGDAAWAHSLLEWWANKDGHKAIQYTLLFLLAEANLAE